MNKLFWSLSLLVLGICSCEITFGEAEPTVEKITLGELFEDVKDPEDSKELTYYKNDSLNFKFGYPSNWKKPNDKRGKLVFVQKSDSYTETKPRSNFAIMVQENYNQELIFVKDSLIETWKQNAVFTKVEIVNELDTTFYKEEAFEIVVQGSFKQYNTWFDITWKTIIFMRNKTLFKLTYTCPRNEFSEQFNTRYSIFNSFQFLEEN